MRNLSIILLLLPLAAFAQKERSDVRTGNKLYDKGKYPEAEVEYKRALEKNINSYEANFNLAGALYKQGRYEDAISILQKTAQDGSDLENQSKALYNLGNNLLKLRKLDESIESYKSALRINPTDVQAKFNLAYAQKLKQEDENKDKNQDQNQDQNQNQNNQDQNQDQNQNQDKQDDKQDKKDDKQNQQQPPPQKSEAERMLKAIQAAEDNTKKKVDEQKVQVVGKQQGKQW